jgi:hypothetical protein
MLLINLGTFSDDWVVTIIKNRTVAKPTVK